MTQTTFDGIFIDTNILVYANLTQSPFYAYTAQRLNALRQQDSTLWINRQVLREYLTVMTRQDIVTEKLSISTLVEDIHYFFECFCIAEDNPVVTARLLQLIQQISIGGTQIHDANIIATMQAYNIPALLTHNTKDFARFSDLITILPLSS